MWLCLLPVLALLSMSSAKRGFILTGPKVYDVGKTETLVLHLFDVKESGNVSIRLVVEGTVYSEVTVPIEDGQSKSVELPIPSKLPESIRKARLEVDGLIGDYKMNNSLEVGMRVQRPMLFLSTDKPLYKAGQTVHVRVLTTDADLRPRKDAKMAQIWISDPNKVRTAQWSNVSLSEGLIHKTMPLPEEPVLGRWSVEIKTDEDDVITFFNVEEYVLPSFEVKITPPPYLLLSHKIASWEVCAKYTYGKQVKGKLFTKLSLSPTPWGRNIPSIEKMAQIKGCTTITLPLEKPRNTHKYGRHRYTLEFYAEVTEDGTGTKMNSTSTISPSNIPYIIKKIDGQHPHYFRPGIPLRLAMAVETPDSKPLPGKVIKVCLKTTMNKWDDDNTVINIVKVCKNYTSDKNGNIHFTIPPQDSSTVSLKVEATVEEGKVDGYKMEKPRDSFTLSPWFSTSGSHIQLERVPKMNCTTIGADTKVAIRFHLAHSETGIKKFHYQIMSRGDIAEHGDFDLMLEADSTKNTIDDTYLPDSNIASCNRNDFRWESNNKRKKYLSENYLFFKFNETMTPRVRILLYTVTDDGDIVADAASYDTDLCFPNQVDMKFAEEEQAPGADTTIRLMAEPQSLCSVGIVDKNVYILQKGDLLTGSKIKSRILPLDTSSQDLPTQRTPDSIYCQDRNAVSYFDAMSAFSDNGGLVLSDLPLETRPCQPTQPSRDCSRDRPPVYLHPPPPPRPFYPRGGFYPYERTRKKAPTHHSLKRVPPPSVTVRTKFPDTWLFKLYRVGDEGSLEVKQKMPDSITEWQGEAACIHPDKGLGLSKPASIIAFQPFFASLTLPYSVVRGEIVPIIVTVFNYLKDCLPIKVHLDQTEHFELYNGTLTQSLCVCGDESPTVYFHVRPEKRGIMNVTVTAETTGDRDACRNFDIAPNIKKSDTLTKPVLVEAEGFTKEEVFNSYFCLPEEEGGNFEVRHLLKLPEKKLLVPDSARAYTSVTGDLMGPTLEGLEKLVRMPTGCGEQNMIGLVPNIVVLDYLRARKTLKKDVERKAVEHIRQGYVRQQKYRHPDGSYSAFGVSDKEGSMWLTAFVVRTFASARRYVNIDEDSLRTSRNWILSRQRENGCFPMVGTVHHKAMKGGVSKEDETTSTLTAYILISMLESGEMDKEAVASAIRCIEAKVKPSSYSTSLFAYATALAKHSSSSEYLERLTSVAMKDGGLLYWEDSDRSISVETASYAILAMLKSESKEYLSKLASIAKWLTKQRNSYGGFYSTQDTIMALQALGKYGSFVSDDPPDMGISVETDIIYEMFQVSQENKLLMQRTNLKLKEKPETSVEILASGSGCALVQTILRYNVYMPTDGKDFMLLIRTHRKSGCTIVEMFACARYRYQDGSNMAIIEIKMVTGYSPVIDTVKELLRLEQMGIRRYEFKEDTNTLYLYMNMLTSDPICFSFDVIQEVKVLDVKPSYAKVYDYYDEDKSISVPYSINETCTE